MLKGEFPVKLKGEKSDISLIKIDDIDSFLEVLAFFSLLYRIAVLFTASS